MRIAITGSAGIGKSTLANALASRLQMPVIEEGYQCLEQAESVEGFVENLLFTLQHKSNLENSAQSFITDRGSIDLLHLWLLSNNNFSRAENDAFIQQCIAQARAYDYIIIPAWNSFPLQQNAANTRTMNSLTQLRNHATLVGYCYMWTAAERIIEIPQTINTPEERVSFIVNSLLKKRPNLQLPIA